MLAKAKYWFLFFVTLLFVSGCSFDAYYEKLNDKYFLYAIDSKSDMMLCVDIDENIIGVVSKTVYAVGYDDQFIIVMQHPQDSLGRMDKTVTNFYIVPLSMQVSPYLEKNVIGPLQEAEFQEKRQSLGISHSLKFTREFKELYNNVIW